MNQSHLKLCLLTQIPQRPFHDYQQFILNAIAGGITSLQLRVKNCSQSEILFYATQLKKLLSPYQIPLIINDHVDIAKAVDADGVHLGQDDTCIKKARAILGPHKWIGISVETFEELAIANQSNNINYIAASAVFPTKNKSNCKTIWGLTNLKKITATSIHPVVAIGGIQLENLRSVMNCNVAGVAVIGAIHDHPETTEITRQLIQAINERETIDV